MDEPRTGDDGPEPPVESLPDLFWIVARRLRHDGRRTMEPLEVTPSLARALRTLDRHGPCRPGELARHLHIAPRSATEVVDHLEHRDLVERRADPSDRRALLVGLTVDGSALLDQLRVARERESERLFARLRTEDRVELTRILRVLIDGADRSVDGSPAADDAHRCGGAEATDPAD